MSQQIITGEPKVRDIFATCLKGLLKELSQTYSSLVCQSVLPKMLEGISPNQGDCAQEIGFPL